MYIAQIEKKNYSKKEKSSYSDNFLVATTLTPPRHHQKSNISKSNASTKECISTIVTRS
jgi:hypothetical protein